MQYHIKIVAFAFLFRADNASRVNANLFLEKIALDKIGVNHR